MVDILDRYAMILDLNGLGYAYPGGRTVLKNVSFSVARGERVALEGPNGSGKSTILQIIMGLLPGFTGELSVLGKSRRVEDDFHDVRRQIGLVFQDSDDQLFCPTVEEDIAFGPLNLGMSHDEARRAVDEVTKLLDIEHLRDRATHKLSGGEKRLVSLATVFSMKPVCYLLDEPTLGLDSKYTEKLLRFLHEHAETYLITCHDKVFLHEAKDRSFSLGT